MISTQHSETFAATLAATGPPAPVPGQEAEAGAGTVLAGRYRLVRLVGRGGMGSVWEGEHLTLHTPVALKLINPGSADERARARFLREAQAAAGLRSPHVVQIFDYGVHETTPYMVMELLAGETLAARLEREGRLSPAMTLEFTTHVIRAVARAHEAELVHRDLKPENIFIVASDAGEVLKVLDFGIAKAMADDSVDVRTRTGAIVGTPFYMSPEQLMASSRVDGRADLWSIAVIVYECLLGRRPFAGESLAEIVVAVMTGAPPVPSAHGVVPAGFDAWFARATLRDPDARFQSASALLEALTPILSAAQGTREQALAVPSRSRRGGWWLVPVAVLAVATVATLVAVGPWREQGPPADAGEREPVPVARPSDPSPPATPSVVPSPSSIEAAPLAPPSPDTESEAKTIGSKRSPPRKRDSPTAKGFDVKELEY